MKKTNKLILLLLMLLFLTVNLKISAKNIKDIWTTMPDSMIVYMDKKARMECIDLIEKGMTPEITNRLGGKTRIDTITSDFISATLSEASNIQIKLLPAFNDTIICYIHTYKGPLPESSIALYTQKWNKISEIKFSIEKFLNKPDSIEQSEFENIKLMMDPDLITANMSPDSEEISVSASVANVTDEEQDKINAILVQRKFKWNGNSFN